MIKIREEISKLRRNCYEASEVYDNTANEVIREGRKDGLQSNVEAGYKDLGMACAFDDVAQDLDKLMAVCDTEKCTLDKLAVAYRNKAEFFEKERRETAPPTCYEMEAEAKACREVVYVLTALAENDTKFINDQIKFWHK